MKSAIIVDDSATMRNMVKGVLEKQGYEIVAEASDGEAAVNHFGELKPDLVTMDIVMPKLDGLEATRRIREMDKDARIVIISAMSQQQIVMEAIKAGARDFVIKPFPPSRLREALERAEGEA